MVRIEGFSKGLAQGTVSFIALVLKGIKVSTERANEPVAYSSDPSAKDPPS